MTRRPTTCSGFTLVELMVSATLATIIMGAVLSTFLFMGRNLVRLGNYQSLENESRKALAYLRRDFAIAQSVKSGTTPTTSAVTLTVPSGEVSYTYDSTARSLRRQANFGANRDFTLLLNASCECTQFFFRYYTTEDGAPTDQSTSSVNIPYSIKQIQVDFVVESPATVSALVRTRYESASSRFLFRNRGASDGT